MKNLEAQGEDLVADLLGTHILALQIVIGRFSEKFKKKLLHAKNIFPLERLELFPLRHDRG
ncbi:MAG: hypothetical protein ACYDIC_16490 [Desulfobaccales bacterium]